GYAMDESLLPSKIVAYLVDNKKITKMKIKPSEGIIVKTFDDVINKMNRTSDDIFYTLQED
ncbi:hypothetical protein, partial [Candidatus Albibeggiatoa sp. nov. BB20]|uniref:hypothetical protein n=1 Tax=Candidatus Albibeggiatoa sp. nov. BB20 TaxID=3162723 RepID=UPI003365A797